MFIDDRQLRFFREIAEQRSINRAAGKLHITQPALSRRMKSLEHQIGAELFVRSKTGVDLTPAGRRLLERSRFINEAFDGLGDARETQVPELRSVGFGMAPGASLLVLDMLVHAFHVQLPHQVLHLVEGVASEMCDKVLDGELQIALISGAIRSPHFESEVVWKEPMYFVAPKLASDDLPFAMPTRDPVVKQIIEGELVRRGRPARIEFEVCASPLIKRLVSGGHACSILPYSAVYEELQTGEIQCMALPGAALPRTLLWHKARRPLHVIEPIRRMVRGIADQLLASTSRHGLYLGRP
jgi:DNA-binding transcriptional LysR family regulator